jgi:hypothetical protein
MECIFSCYLWSYCIMVWQFLDDRLVKIQMRFVAFPATDYDEVLSGYQPGQMVEQWKSHLIQLIAWENFIISLSRSIWNIVEREMN